MPKYLLKDSQSKNDLYEWIKEGVITYARNSFMHWNDEDSLCGHFFSSISGDCAIASGMFNIRAYKVRGRGPSAPERQLGADGIGLISLKFPSVNLEGFFLYQAKKAERQNIALRGEKSECQVMLSHSPASYLLVLLPAEIKMVGAMAVGAQRKNDPSLQDLPFVTYPRFIVEHMLHGLMLEPIISLRNCMNSNLRAEIKNIITIIGGDEERIENAKRSIEETLHNLDLNIEK